MNFIVDPPGMLLKTGGYRIGFLYWRMMLGMVLVTPFCLWGQAKLMIKDVQVITMENDHVMEGFDVWISGGLIQNISPHQKDHPAGYKLIDGSGKYLLPAYSEMHAHIPVAEGDDDTLVKETLFLYLANGITTIRGMLGNPYHLALKKQVDADLFPSPRIYTASPSLNGNTIRDEEEALQKVCSYYHDGYDFLKIHPGIKRSVFDAAVHAADSVGIDFSGHVPEDVGIEHAIAAGYATIDHMDGYIQGLVATEQRTDPGFFGINLADKAAEGNIEVLVALTKKAGISIVPTQTLMTRWLSPKSAAAMSNEPEMIYVSPALRYEWRQRKEQLIKQTDYPLASYHRFIALRQKYLRTFLEAGVPILLGSDAPQVFNVPGFSIHHEMKAMADAGISKMDILKAATVNVAHFFEAPKRGMVKVGHMADLVLLEKNPLEDISHTKSVAGVIYRGHWLSKKEIDQKLVSIAHRHKSR